MGIKAGQTAEKQGLDLRKKHAGYTVIGQKDIGDYRALLVTNNQ
jgi:hypothetical protein